METRPGKCEVRNGEYLLICVICGGGVEVEIMVGIEVEKGGIQTPLFLHTHIEGLISMLCKRYFFQFITLSGEWCVGGAFFRLNRKKIRQIINTFMRHENKQHIIDAGLKYTYKEKEDRKKRKKKYKR